MLSNVGSSHADPFSQKDRVPASGSVSGRSTSWSIGRSDMKVPSRNSTPRNSASCGMGVVVALVSGPRTVSEVRPLNLMTTISQ